jgi:hypothetical protein
MTNLELLQKLNMIKGMLSVIDDKYYVEEPLDLELEMYMLEGLINTIAKDFESLENNVLLFRSKSQKGIQLIGDENE